MYLIITGDKVTRVARITEVMYREAKAGLITIINPVLMSQFINGTWVLIPFED